MMDESHHSNAVAAVPEDQPNPQLYAATSRQLMDMILFDSRADGVRASATVHNVGHKGLVEAVVRSRRYHANVNDEDVDGCAAGAAAAAGEDAEGEEVNGAIAIIDITDPETSEEMQVVLEEAYAAYRSAEKQLKEGLVQCEDWLTLRDRLYQSGAIFSVAGYPDEAAKCFLHATFINRAFKDDDEAVFSMSQSAENLKQAHPEIAVEVLVRLAACYSQASLTFQAARCYKEAAEILDVRLERKRAAIAQYTAAMEAYSSTSRFNVHESLARACHERLCFLHTELGHYDVAEKFFLERARSVPRHLPATRFYMYAALAVLARGFGSDEAYFDSLYNTRKRFNALQEIDSGFQKGKENQLMRRLITAFDNSSLNEFDLALLDYNSYKTTVPNAAFNLVCARCRSNLYEHIERFE